MTTPLDLLRGWVMGQAGEAAGWFAESLDALGGGATERELHILLGLAPRRLGKADLALSDADRAEAHAARPGWDPSGWSVDGAARTAALLAFRGQRPFAATFKDLRRTADAAELIALYRGLPLYPEPEALDFEAGEGLRSNLRPVFEAIAHRNPFPHDHFDRHRWNHMVLKALFVGSELAPIVGLDERANPELARILIDYARERLAAGRPVSPELWRPVRPFADLPEIRAELDLLPAEHREAVA
ncbi:MAG TPA: EboA domain-containing protein [Paracoccaceae bacterium]|nr:EboA domain-containing protein [Paracoccaceae bacterium]